MALQTSVPFYFDQQTGQFICQGDWSLTQVSLLQTQLGTIKWPEPGPAQAEITLNGAAITKMDSAGAWLLLTLSNQLKKRGLALHLHQFSEETIKLLAFVEKNMGKETALEGPTQPGFLARMGMGTVTKLATFRAYLQFVGQLTSEVLRAAFRPARWRLNMLASVIYSTGYEALPIIALLSFLIGVVLTYQMGLQLQNYGADIYIVDLLGLSVLREFAPLITAIMVAGRSGSAFTAAIGMMKLNQEIDALCTLGITPAELIILPRIIGLFITLPLLTMWSDIFGILGGMVMSNNMLGITWYDFLQRFPEVIPLRSFIIGIGKAPIFALIIASVGCFQGMQVKYSADSVGQNTTKSVVLAIFFIMMADALFSVLFSKMKL